MKRISFILSLGLLSMASLAIGQSSSALLKAIGTGDVDQIGTYIDGSIDICILDDQNRYDKKAGLDLLRSFFDQNKARGLTKKHAGGNKKSSSTYSIASLSTDQGEYRVFIYTDQDNGKVTLEEIRFSKE